MFQTPEHGKVRHMRQYDFVYSYTQFCLTQTLLTLCSDSWLRDVLAFLPCQKSLWPLLGQTPEKERKVRFALEPSNKHISSLWQYYVIYERSLRPKRYPSPALYPAVLETFVMHQSYNQFNKLKRPGLLRLSLIQTAIFKSLKWLFFHVCFLVILAFTSLISYKLPIQQTLMNWVGKQQIPSC